MENVEYKYTKAEIFNHTWWISETEPKKCKLIFDELLRLSGFTVLNFVEHYFDKQGYTCLWLLAESHLAIHTFPEEERCYVELSSCNEKKMDGFKRLIEPLL